MHTVKLEISEQAFEKVMYLLKSLPKRDVRIIKNDNRYSTFDALETKAYSNHSANLVEEWKDPAEDEIWT